ncbi:MAG: flagellar biosynthesis protein FliQ [Thermodesulfovibrionales bacterium]|nr:flagellar biosynthesis protein FliQ [Thermodesulfovibrionales bacterium]
MTVELVRDIAGEVLKTLLMVSGPVLMVSLIVGLLVSLFQAVTQIQEFTLVFVPKIVAVFICIFLLIPWMARILISFTVSLMDKIPLMVK